MTELIIFSDSYPPYTIGGAEISLSYLVRYLRKDYDVRVISYNGERNSWWHDGVQVDKFQIDLYVPYNHKSIILGNTLHKLRILINRLMSRKVNLSEFCELTRSKYSKHRLMLVDKPLIFQRDFDYLSLTSRLSVILGQLPKGDAIVIADNYRSIITCYLLTKLGIIDGFIANVRDNRFFCTRAEQEMNIDGVTCTHCDHSCGIDKLDRISMYHSLLFELRREALKMAKHVVTTSPNLMQQLSSMIDDSDTRLIPGVIGTDNFIAHVPKPTDITTDSPSINIFFPGSINLNKGHQLLPTIMDIIHEKGVEFSLRIAGSGDRQLLRLIEDWRNSRRYGDCIEILGRVDQTEIGRHYRWADVVIQPCVWPEPWGRVPYEAFAYGVGTVAFEKGGLSHSVPMLGGRLVNPGDMNGFATAMIELGEKYKRHKIDAAITSKVLHDHDQAVLRRWSSLLHEGKV